MSDLAWLVFITAVSIVGLVEVVVIVAVGYGCWAAVHRGEDPLADVDAPIPYVPTNPGRELEASMRRHPAGNARTVFDALEVERLRAIAAADAAQVTR